MDRLDFYLLFRLGSTRVKTDRLDRLHGLVRLIFTTRSLAEHGIGIANRGVATGVMWVYTPCLKKTVQTYFLSELCQISTDCGNFWHKDSKENKLF